MKAPGPSMTPKQKKKTVSENNPTDLLQRFCELAPAEWGAAMDASDACDDAYWVVTMEPYSRGVRLHRTIDLRRDDDSAWALIFLWDYLKDQSVPNCPKLETAIEYAPSYDAEKPYWVIHTGMDGEALYARMSRTYSGKTRIEAVIRACISLWEADHKGLNEPCNSTEAVASTEENESPTKEVKEGKEE